MIDLNAECSYHVTYAVQGIYILRYYIYVFGAFFGAWQSK